VNIKSEEHAVPKRTTYREDSARGRSPFGLSHLSLLPSSELSVTTESLSRLKGFVIQRGIKQESFCADFPIIVIVIIEPTGFLLLKHVVARYLYACKCLSFWNKSYINRQIERNYIFFFKSFISRVNARRKCPERSTGRIFDLAENRANVCTHKCCMSK